MMHNLRRLLQSREGSIIRPFIIISVVVIVVVYLIGFSGVLDKSEYAVLEKENVGQEEVNARTPVQERGYFTLGSTKEEVLAVQGKPSNILNESWFYGSSKVDFRGDTVVSYNNRQRVLHVMLKPKRATTKEYFSIGLTKDEVVTVQGTPTNIVGSTWYYGSSKVKFKNDVVVAFSDRKRVLNVKPTVEPKL